MAAVTSERPGKPEIRGQAPICCTASAPSVMWWKLGSVPKIRDARIHQILFLAALLTTGVLLRDFSLPPVQMAPNRPTA